MGKLHAQLAVLLLPLVLLLVEMEQAASVGVLMIEVITVDPPSADGSPNSFNGKGNQIASSLLGSSTPALNWGVVSSADVNAVCRHIVNTGSLSFSADVVLSGKAHCLTMQITAIEGCRAASDGSGIRALVDHNGVQSAVVCPDNGGSTDCGIYIRGEAVTSLHNLGSRRGLLQQVGGQIGCFPGDASVMLASGELKSMTALALGDKVAVRARDGGLAYEEVYAFGHKDVTAVAEYVQLTLKPINTNVSDPSSQVESRTLELSSLHFAPVSSGNAGEVALYKRGRDISVGDAMWAQGPSKVGQEGIAALSMYVVASISTVQKQGLYNPYTLGGTIVVNGVVASTHSDWFLDAPFQFLGLTHWLPAVYQLVLLPVRMLYRVLGKDLYISTYNQFDALVDIAECGTAIGGSLLTTAFGAISSAAIAAFLLFKLTVSSSLAKQKSN